MQGLTALMLATALVSAPERGCGDEPRAWLELEVPRLERDVLALVIADRFYASDGWFGITIDGELALLVDVRMDGPASRGAFSASFGIALTP